MTEMNVPVNKVANSGLITLDLLSLKPNKDKAEVLDIKDFLFQGLVLREKEFRDEIERKNWSIYTEKHLLITCSTDAIVPHWAFMLIQNKLQDIVASSRYVDYPEIHQSMVLLGIELLETSKYKDQRVIIKGCGEEQIGPQVYLAISDKLLPEVKSLMYGEACSNVPIFKRK